MRGLLEFLFLAILLAFLLGVSPRPASEVPRTASRAPVFDGETSVTEPDSWWSERLSAGRTPFPLPGRGPSETFRPLRRFLAWFAFENPVPAWHAVLGDELSPWPNHPLIDRWRSGWELARVMEGAPTPIREADPHRETFGDYLVASVDSERVPVKWRGIPGRAPGEDLGIWLENLPFVEKTEAASNSLLRHEVLVERRGRERREVQVFLVFERRVLGERFGLDEQARGERWKRIVQVTPDELLAVHVLPVREGGARVGLVESTVLELAWKDFTEGGMDASLAVDPDPSNNFWSAEREERRSTFLDAASTRGLAAGVAYLHHLLWIGLGGA